MSVLVDGKLFIGKSTKPEYLELRFANRHGLITGATGTGKTVTLQGLAEGFSAAGVPVFAADIKGDLSGIAAIGEQKDFLVKRAGEVGLGDAWSPKAFPVDFLGCVRRRRPSHPRHRARHGPPPPLAHAGTQRGAGGRAQHRLPGGCRREMPVVDLKDLRAILNNVSERSKELQAKYGNVAATSVGSIQRRLLVLEEQGAERFFGEPSLDITDFMRLAPDGARCDQSTGRR